MFYLNMAVHLVIQIHFYSLSYDSPEAKIPFSFLDLTLGDVGLGLWIRTWHRACQIVHSHKILLSKFRTNSLLTCSKAYQFNRKSLKVSYTFMLIGILQ